MPTINGTAIHWALPDFAFSGTGIGTLILQTFELTKTDEPESIKTSSGQTCTRIWPDPSTDLSFEYFVSGSGLANAKTQSKVPTPGTIVTLTFTSTNFADASLTAAGTACEVQTGVKIGSTNTSAMKVTLPMKVWPLVTAAATS